MTSLRTFTCRLVSAVLIGAALVASPAAAAPSSIDAPPMAPSAQGSVTMLAQHGFGDRQNSYAWSMIWFNGKLYVGTGRDVMCVEEETSQFYFAFSDIYKTTPAPNVHCTKNPYDLDLRAEIWQYTPRTGRWRMVYRAPADVRNPRARGKFVARDIAYRGMTVMDDGHGQQALFVSGVTADEYIPELAHSHPPRLLRTYDGLHYHDIAVPLIVRRCCGFKDQRPIGFRGLQVWQNHVYVLASTALTGDGAVFEVKHPFSDEASFTQVTPRWMHIFELEQFDGHLYFGTGSFSTGYAVYRTPSAQVPRHLPWRMKAVVTDGAGMGSQMVSVVSMHVFRGHLYVGAVSWYSRSLQGLPESELIRIGHRDQWELVAGNPRKGPDGNWRYPISGLPAGFGNSFNSHMWRMTDEGGALFVGTLDWSSFLQDTQQWAGRLAGLVSTILKPGYGFDLWKSCDGVSWSPVTVNAFGKDPDDFGVRTLVPTSNGFYLGTANHAFGTRIWQANGLSSCGSKNAGRAVAAKAPQSLLTDVQAGGTVVSWERSPGAVRYRVQRAAVHRHAAEPAAAAGRAGNLPVRRHVACAGNRGHARERPAPRPGSRAVRGTRSDDTAVFHRPHSRARSELRLPGRGGGTVGPELGAVERSDGARSAPTGDVWSARAGGPWVV